MKVLLRTFGVLLAFLALSNFAFFFGALFGVRFSIGGVVAVVVAAAAAVLCVRAAVWLWSERPFWRDQKRAAEVATAATSFLMLGVLAQLEKITDGAFQAAIQLSAVGLVVAGYFVFRRIIPTRPEPDEKGSERTGS